MSRNPPKRGRDNRRPSRLIVGLGNPGRRYSATLHNAGFLAVDRLAQELGVRLAGRGEIEYGIGDAEGEVVLLAKPQTFMNRSGTAVAPLYRSYADSPEELVVIHDDLDLPPGAVRLKRGGGTGGHNGLRSLQSELGTPAFLRVRIGIGRPPEGVDAAEYVLEYPPQELRDVLSGAAAHAAEAVRDLLRDGFDKAMTRWNMKRKALLPHGAEGANLLAPGNETGGSISRKEETTGHDPEV